MGFNRVDSMSYIPRFSTQLGLPCVPPEVIHAEVGLEIKAHEVSHV
jgi:hypothetical protein